MVATSRSYSARKLNGPALRNPNPAATNTTRLRIIPALASVHAGRMTPVEKITATMPSAHHQRGQVTRAADVVRNSSAESSQSAPDSGEIGSVDSGSSAQWNAFA